MNTYARNLQTEDYDQPTQPQSDQSSLYIIATDLEQQRLLPMLMYVRQTGPTKGVCTKQSVIRLNAHVQWFYIKQLNMPMMQLRIKCLYIPHQSDDTWIFISYL